MRLSSVQHAVALSAVMGLLLQSGLPAQERIDALEPAVHVKVVNVDVRVTDKNGNAITDLSPQDFELYEDGKPVEITNFYAVQDRKSVLPHSDRSDAGPIPGEGSARSDAVPALAAGAAPPLPPAEQQLHLIAYVDNLNLRPLNRNRVVRSLRGFVAEHVREGDRTMIVTYERSLNIRQPFTTNLAELSRSLQKLQTMSAQGVHADSDRLDALRAIQEIEDDQRNLTRALTMVQTYAESQYNDLEFTINALRDFVEQLAGLPGRKALVYVSDGISQRPGEDLFYALNDVSQRFTGSRAVSLTAGQRFDASRRFQELGAQAASGRVAFFTIDAAGLRAPASSSVLAERPGVVGPVVDSVYRTNLQAPLQTLAEMTGGKAVINTNKVGPVLERISRDLWTYYSLGFHPAHSGDGRYHHLKVRVKRKGLRVTHRQGYRDETAEVQMSQAVMAGLTFGYSNNPLGVRLQRGQALKLKDGNYQIPVRVLVPLSGLTLLPGESERIGRLRLFMAVRDDNGDSTPVQQVSVPIRIDDERWRAVQDTAYPYEIPITVAPGEQRLAVGIRDELGATESLVVEYLSVGT